MRLHAACKAQAQLLAMTLMLTAGNTWTQLEIQSGSKPAGRSRATMTWDTESEGLWMFGGQDVSDWSFTGAFYFYSLTSNTWSLKTGNNMPEGRWMHSAVLDTANRAIYIFGGSKRSLGSTTPGTTFSDLYSFTLATEQWNQLSSGPVASSRHSAVWDTTRGCMIVFGGESDNGTKLSGMQEYFAKSDKWTVSSPTGTAPSARLGHLAVWDTLSDVMLMCCGHGDASVYVPYTNSWSTTYNDLWSYAAGTGWVELVPSGSFTPRGEAAGVWDATMGSILGFGGYFDQEGHMNSMFGYTATSNWTEETVGGVSAPLPRDGHAATWDPQARQLYMLGGWVGSTYEGVLWRLDAANLSLLSVRSSTAATSSTAPESTTAATGATPASTSAPSVFVQTEQSEYEAARGLLSMLALESSSSNSSNSSANASTGILGSIMVDDGLSLVVVWALKLVSGGAPVELELSGALSLGVPQEVIAQATETSSDEFVLVTASVPSAATFATPSESLISPLLSVNFRAADCRRLPMHALARPVELRFGVQSNQSNQGQCRFWDEEKNRWSEKGVRRSDSSDLAVGTVVCLTSHLTIFAVVLEAVKTVLQCSTAAQVLSAEGFRNIGAVQWLRGTASIFFLVSIGLFAVALAWGWYLDLKASRTIPAEEVEAALMVSRMGQDHKDGEETEEPREESGQKGGCCMNCLDTSVWLASSIFSIPATDSVSELLDARVATVNRCISSVHSFRAGACRQSIKVAMAGKDQLRSSLSRKWQIHYHAAVAVEKFLSSSWLQRVMILLPCMHPWVTLRLASIFRPHVVRAALVILKLVSAAFTNAMFFTSTGTQAMGSDDECTEPQSFAEKLLAATIVGFFSACMGDVLIVVLALVQRRNVLIRDRWTEKMKKSQLRRWRARRLVFWFVWFIAIVFSILYTTSFLANVSAPDTSRWLESTGVSVLQDFLFRPLLLALGYATCSTLILCSSHVRETVEKQWARPAAVDLSPAERICSTNDAGKDCKSVCAVEDDSLVSNIIMSELV